MIVIDGTSLWALFRKVSGSAIQHAIDKSDVPMIFITQQTLLEATQNYFEEHGEQGKAHLEQRMEEADITLVPSIKARTAAALAAFEHYGEGRRPGSSLTLGDCAAYTRAKSLGADLVSERLSAYEIIGLEWMTMEYKLIERDKRLRRLAIEIPAKLRSNWHNDW